MDIFLSYSSKDRGRIESLVQALEGQGWSVFWDRQHILPGEAFGPVIEKHLAAVKCVVAVWSEHSVAPESYWVQNEAATGLQRGILVPVTIDDVVAPIAFRHLQSAQMIGWPGQSNSRELDLLLRTVTRYVEPGAVARAPEAATRSESQGPVEIGRLAAVSARPIARGALLSLRGWITGGLLGGLVAGLLIGVIYNAELFRAGQSSFGPIATEIAVYAALVGVTTSVFSRYFIVLFRYLDEQRFPPLFMFNDAFAGALGGVLGGAAVGMLGGYWFGLRHLDAVSTPLLVYGATAGPPFVVFLIFLHDLRRLRDRAARTRTVRLVVAVIGVTYLAALLGIAFLRRFGINEEWFGRAFDDQTYLQAGAIIGVMIGGMLGAQLGLTLWLNRLMAGPTETV